MNLRESNLQALRQRDLDLLIVGGGINGAVCAAALTAAGARVGLVERDDFAAATSSNSSNLIWGGIKYLEGAELLLVDKLCRSRNRLLRAYPSRVREIRFLAALVREGRLPAPLLYLGTLLYWFIGRCATRAPRYLSASQLYRDEPLLDRSQVVAGVEYSDCFLPEGDARFVFGFIRTALDQGCSAANYVEALGARRQGQDWITRVRDRVDGSEFTLRSRVLINACGPWADAQNALCGAITRYHHRFSKGVHLVLDRAALSERVLTFFASDGRLFFVMPLGSKLCVGTTDTRQESPEAEVSDDDRHFILQNVNRLLRLPRPLQPADILAERCGVRPLAVSDGAQRGDWMKLSRKHVIEVDRERRLLSLFGGKLSDCLNIGNEAVRAVAELGIALPREGCAWYGEPTAEVKARYLQQAAAMGLDRLIPGAAVDALCERWWRRYGSDAFELLAQIADQPGQAQPLLGGSDYLRAEVALMARREMVIRLDDFLRRRTLISQQVPQRQLLRDPGLVEVCEILFGARATERLQQYRQACAEGSGA